MFTLNSRNWKLKINNFYQITIIISDVENEQNKPVYFGQFKCDVNGWVGIERGIRLVIKLFHISKFHK